jgi:protein-tyrosine phosphatase
MAEALLRQRLAAMGLADQVAVLSAGVWAEEGRPASRDAIMTLRPRGIVLVDHRSQPITEDLLDQADLVLVMEEAHRRSLFYVSPQHLGKVFLLSEMADRHDDVEDPFGGTTEDYTRTVALLDQLLDAGLPQILKRIDVQAPL